MLGLLLLILILHHTFVLVSRDDDRLTPLCHAVIHGCPRSVKVLLDYGADIDTLDKNRVSLVCCGVDYIKAGKWKERKKKERK